MNVKLRTIRVSKGYKQCEFAKLIGISREYLRLIEKGKAKNPSVNIMKKIAAALNSTVQDLFFEE